LQQPNINNIRNKSPLRNNNGNYIPNTTNGGGANGFANNGNIYYELTDQDE